MYEVSMTRSWYSNRACATLIQATKKTAAYNNFYNRLDKPMLQLGRALSPPLTPPLADDRILGSIVSNRLFDNFWKRFYPCIIYCSFLQKSNALANIIKLYDAVKMFAYVMNDVVTDNETQITDASSVRNYFVNRFFTSN